MNTTTLRKLHSKGDALSRYAVIADGEEVGQVFQRRAETVTRYSGSSYGYRTARTVWAWEADNMGDYEFDTRKEALGDLLSMVDLVSNSV